MTDYGLSVRRPFALYRSLFASMAPGMCLVAFDPNVKAMAHSLAREM